MAAARAGVGGALLKNTRQPEPPDHTGGGDKAAGCRAGRPASTQKRTREPHRGRGCRCTRARPGTRCARAGLAAGGRCAHTAGRGHRPRHAQCAARSVGARPAGPPAWPARRADNRATPRKAPSVHPRTRCGETCSVEPLRVRGWAGAPAAQCAVRSAGDRPAPPPACVPRSREPPRGRDRRCTRGPALCAPALPHGVAARARLGRGAGCAGAVRGVGDRPAGSPAGAPEWTAEPHRGWYLWCPCVGARHRLSGTCRMGSPRARPGWGTAARNAGRGAEHRSPPSWSARPACRTAGGTSGSLAPGTH